MKREIEDRTILDVFTGDFVNVVEKHAKYIIVSGFVAIAHRTSRAVGEFCKDTSTFSLDQAS